MSDFRDFRNIHEMIKETVDRRQDRGIRFGDPGTLDLCEPCRELRQR